MQSAIPNPATTSSLRWLALVGCTAWLCAPGLIASQVPAFRDAYHFYYPQAVWLEQCAQQGIYFPSWNPDEGLGVSLSGQPSAALYYPLRPLWWLPGLSVAQKFSLVIVVHLLIAAIGMQLAALKLGVSDQGAWLAAVSYALSCPVFFQHTNLIYLCSAAWIGFALAAVLDALCATNFKSRCKSCATFALATGLMLLGGDPQTAVNTFIVAGLIFASSYLLSHWASRAAAGSTKAIDLETDGPQAFSPMVNSSIWLWLVAAAGLFLLLGFVQWLPAWRWASHSGRVATTDSNRPSSTAPTSATPPAGNSLTPSLAAALRESSPSPNRRYDFSLSPWHLLTCLWPTAGGHYLPNNSRAFAVIPAEGRMWIPSLYFGCWPCLLVFLAVFKPLARRFSTKQTIASQPVVDNGDSWSDITLGSKPAQDCKRLAWQSTIRRSLAVVALFALLAAFGNYSLVWLLRETLNGLGLTSVAAQLPKDHVGSLVWLLNLCIPGYAMFRYPAKWSVWFVATASLLAATQLERLPTSAPWQLPQRLRRSIQIVSLTGVLLSSGVWLAATAGCSLDPWLARVAPDPWLGPPNSRSIAISLAIACVVPYFVLSLRPAGSMAACLPAVLTRLTPSVALITLIEMTICASCWISYVPAPTASDQSLRRISTSQTADASNTRSKLPFVWINRSQADLQRDRVALADESFASLQARYQETWLLGKLGLLADLRCLNASQSIEPLELAQLRSWLGRHDHLQAAQPNVDRVLRELGVTHRLIHSQPLDSLPADSDHFAWQAVANPQPLCQLWIAGQAQSLDSRAIQWQWESSDQLTIHIDSPHAGTDADVVLLILQTNDGGWLVRNQADQRLAIAESPWLIEIALGAADQQLRLTRKWLW